MSGSEPIGSGANTLAPIASPSAADDPSQWQAELNWKVEENTYDFFAEMAHAGRKLAGDALKKHGAGGRP